MKPTIALFLHHPYCSKDCVDAMKILKDSGLNVVKDEIKGGYVVTTQNGDLILSPLLLESVQSPLQEYVLLIFPN